MYIRKSRFIVFVMLAVQLGYYWREGAEILSRLDDYVGEPRYLANQSADEVVFTAKDFQRVEDNNHQAASPSPASRSLIEGKEGRATDATEDRVESLEEPPPRDNTLEDSSPEEEEESPVSEGQSVDSPPPQESSNTPPHDTTLEIHAPTEEDAPSGHDAFSTPAVQCRKNLQDWQNANIDRWMDSAMPWMEWIWDMTDPVTNKQHYLVMLLLIDTGLGQTDTGKGILYPKGLVNRTWTWQDQQGNSHNATPVFTERDRYPGNDRFYLRLDPPTDDTVPKSLAVTDFKAEWWLLPEDTTTVEYDLEPYLKCSNLEKQEKIPAATTKQQGVVRVGACLTRFWGQQDLLPEWIEYYRLLGISHFWIFVAEPFDRVLGYSLPGNDTDVTYVPYDYTWSGHRHKRPRHKPEYDGENMFQAASNNHCLYLAKQHNMDWVFTPDVDEYVAIVDEHIAKRTAGKELQSYLKQFNKNKEVGEVCLEGVAYGRNRKVEPKTKHNFKLTIDFTCRMNKTLGMSGGRPKCFYRPSKVDDVWVHGSRGNVTRISAEDDRIELRHYRTPLLGVYETEAKDLVSYPAVRDRYRSQIIEALTRKGLSFPDFRAHMDAGYNAARDENMPKANITLEKIDGKPLEFLHIPKSGGPAVEAAAARRNVTWGMCRYKDMPTPDTNAQLKVAQEYPGCVGRATMPECGGSHECWHEPPATVIHHNPSHPYANSALFTVVRNPYTRLISAFYCPRGGYKGKKKDAKALNTYIQKKIVRRKKDLQVTPQSKFIFDGLDGPSQTQVVDHILFYEGLQGQLDTLMTAYDLPIALGKNDVTGLSKNQLGLKALDPQTLGMINDEYAYDFALFGYDKIDPQMAGKNSVGRSYDTRSVYQRAS